jgi:hypothetical protein
MPRYDTYIELRPTEEQSVRSGTYQFGYTKPIAIKGFQKLINKWAKCFLTPEGTDLSDRTYGSPFPNLIGSNITSREDVSDVVQIAVDKTNVKIQEYQAADPPEDPREILDDAELESIVFDTAGTGVEVYIRIRNQAGELLRVQLPPVVTT